MILRLLVIALIFAVTTIPGAYVKAQLEEKAEEEPTQESSQPEDVKEPAPIEDPRENSKYLAAVSYSPFELPIPNKFGLTVGMVTSPKQTWELAFMKGSLSVPGGFRNLGSLNDTRVSLVGRQFFGDSFHMSYGASYFDFSADIGDELIKNVSNGVYPSMNAMRIQGLGFNVGLGNTWILKKNVMIGVDWLSWSQPFIVTKRSSDFIKSSDSTSTNEYVENTMRIVSYLPRLAILHLYLGMIF